MTLPAPHHSTHSTPWHGSGRAPDLLSVDEALTRILAHFAPLADHERVPVVEALGRVLVEDVPADVDLPPFDNSAMDGYAIRSEDVASASAEQPVALRVIGEIAAGSVATTPLESGQAYRILTGAAMPSGADSVVPYELTDGKGFGGWSGEAAMPVAAEEREVRVFCPIEQGDNVRYAGEDQRRGTVLVRAGSVLRPGEVAVLASAGRDHAWVHRRPRVAILSTGDELVPADQVPGPGQIRDINGIALAALVRAYGGEPILLEVAADREEAVRAHLIRGIEGGADMLLSSGGVSMGDYDVVKRVLQDEGEVGFWSIDIRPGKPLAFGHFRGVPILGLPGNPVSSMVTFEVFARPALLRLAGHTRVEKVELLATALETISNTSGREHFMRGIVERRLGDAGDGEWTVHLTGEQGSNIITSMSRANALVRVPKGHTLVQPGERVRVLMLDWPSLW
jgi:molybdopterin molybdotransferase